MGRIVDTDALCRVIWVERIMGGFDFPSIASACHLPVCHQSLCYRTAALVHHRSCQWANGIGLCTLWAWSSDRVSNKNHSSVLSYTCLGDTVCLYGAV